MKMLLKYLGSYKKESVLAPLFKFLEACFELIVPIVVSAIIDNGIEAGKGAGYVAWMCVVLVALGAVGLVCAVFAQFFAAKAAAGFAKYLRRDLFNKMQSLSYAEIDGLGTSRMITRMTSDVNQVQNGVNMVLRLFMRSPVIVFGAMICAFIIDAFAGAIFAGAIAVLCIIVFGILLITIPLYRRVQGNLDGITTYTREALTGSRVIRAFCNEDKEIEAFNAKNTALRRSQTFAGRISALLNPLTYAIINAAIIILLYTGAIEVDAGTLSNGNVVALYNYMSQILVELIKLANLIITVTKSFACAGRLSEVLSMKSSLVRGSSERHEDMPFICFDNVCMKYSPDAGYALSGVSFTAQRGETIGIIGGTGSGKTTLVNLIPHFYDASLGGVYVDGVNVNGYTDEDIRSKCGIVPQRAVLFKGTIAENIRWGKEDATDEEVMQAIDAAQASDVVKSKRKGLDEMVEQGGLNFSGGQRQRLTIARALVKRPEILILDDSASALDYATDAALRRSIKNLDYKPTVFIVSQRTSSIRNADKIIVLEHGEVAGIGTHEELLKNCELYREIHYSQYEKKEEA
ncbi:MAG TPA: ABC transporter ATP-binding protein [Candidatus Coproplasma excrementigallinarum]|uniref:ABC transporter ATP-binding protein n=1 Tax=Candidatus Coproplasma excrementigallinarum TaxID=2840747 RepID=A0A9D1MJP5_9FIRM|nr:ABC transporter ATP-binding protein [Candidatus Coproplasma excrementigallinarum]